MIVTGIEIREDVDSFVYSEFFESIFFDIKNNNYEVSCSKEQYDRFLKVLFDQTKHFIKMNNGTVINLNKVKYIDTTGIGDFAKIVFEDKIFLAENRILRGMVKVGEIIDKLEH